MLKENCGVLGTYFIECQNPHEVIYAALLSLQHRGQESFGIASIKGNKIILKKSLGLISYHFDEEFLEIAKNEKVIAHVRYSTTGDTTIEDAQPSLVEFEGLQVALAFNGNIVNYMQIRKNLKEAGYVFKGRGDGEILAAYIAKNLKDTKDIEKTIDRTFEEVEGAYSSVFLTNEGTLVAFRDPHGFRPLNLGSDGLGNLLIASETVAHDVNNFINVEPIKPAELLVLSDNGLIRKELRKNIKRNHCMFEFVYFSRPDSVFEGKTVYEVRWKLGQELARTYTTDADIIVPIPDSARPAAEAISRETGIPVVEGLIKNRYIARTFIMPTQKEREKNVKLKLNPVKSLIKDKKVLLVDDSIVRGTTMKKIVEMIRNNGAKKVYIWITCPPIISPCFYGIDIAMHGELIAATKKIEEIAKEIGADELRYQTLDSLKRAIGLGENICTGCLTGIYPTPLAQKLSDKLRNKENKERIRYWEMEIDV